MTYLEWNEGPDDIWDDRPDDPDCLPRLMPPVEFHYQEWWIGSGDLDYGIRGSMPRFYNPGCYPPGSTDGIGTGKHEWEEWNE